MFKLILCILLFGAVDFSTVTAAPLPPNIIIMMADDMGFGDTSAYLNQALGPTAAPIAKTLLTPNLERLAAQGILFTDVHTASSMCSPSRYSILTGRYPWRTYKKLGVIGAWAKSPLIGPGRPTLATLLSRNGYRTAVIGKWHLGFTWMGHDGQPAVITANNEASWDKVRVGEDPAGGYLTSILDGPLAHGFDYFFGLGGNFQSDYPWTLKAYVENNAFVGVPAWNGAPPQAGVESVGPGLADWDQQRMGERYINRALDYIDEHVTNGVRDPFFLYYVPNANHVPYDPAEQIFVQGRTLLIRDQALFSDGSDGELREDMVYENDLALGLLLDKLTVLNDPRTGRPLRETTLVIFTSDNGPDWDLFSSAGLRDRKQSLYEGGHRVPFIAAWPGGGVPAGAVSSANFGQVDLYATFAGLLGHTMGPDEAEDSENILPALLGQVPDSQFTRSHSLVSHGDSLSTNDLPDDAALAIREQSLLMMIDGSLVNRDQLSGAGQGRAVPIKLFDLDADLHQDIDLLAAPEHQALVDTLASRLLRFHNKGYSRYLGLGDGQILHTDGGVDLRNDRSGAIGYQFTVGNQPLVVRSLGMWDDAADDQLNQETSTNSDGQTVGVPDGLDAAHVVRLFDRESQQILADAIVNNGTSYRLGEFRYVDLTEPVTLAAGRTYALTVDTSPNDGDPFHHFAAYTAVGPSPSSLVGGFKARVAAVDGDYPDQYPDGVDGLGNRHPDMFQHRMFVGPNARIEAADSSCGAPTYDPATDAGLYLWEENCGNPTRSFAVRAAGGGSASAVTYAGQVDADKAFSVVTPFELESTDVLVNSGLQIDYQLIVRKRFEDGFDFSVASGANVCFGLDLPAGARVLVGPNATPVTAPFDLTTYQACATAPVADICGAPIYDPATDAGLYLWEENCGNVTRSFSVRAAGGGSASTVTYAGQVDANQAFSVVTPFLLESTDVLVNSGLQIDYQLIVRKQYEDGFNFSVASGANVCFGLDLPVGIDVLVGPEAVPVAAPFSLPELGACTL